MDAFSLMLSGVRIIGWVLLHFLWQAALVGMLYAAVRSVLPRGEWRYRFGMGALIVLAGCPVFTGWWLLDTAATAGQAQTAIDTVALAAPLSSATVGAGLDWQAGLDALLPWLVLAWSAGVLLLSLRAWQQWRRLKVMVRMADRVPLWQGRLNLIARRFGLRRRVAVLCSKFVATPILVGWIRPVILLPMAVACDFPATQVELILAHELAHLKRLDPVANLFQVVLETLHFYHPVVHWISRDVRNEREICCDQLALSITGGSRQEFAATLAELGELRQRPGSLLLAANGGVLLDRVQHMVLPGQRVERRRTPAHLVAVLLGATLIALTLRLEWRQIRQQETLAEVSLQLPSTISPLVIAMKSPMVPPLDIAVAAFLPHLAPLRSSPAMPVRHVPVAGAIEEPLPSVPSVAIPGQVAPAEVVALRLATAAMPKVAPITTTESPPSPVSTPPLTPIRIRQPIYPQMALMRGVEGKVVIEFGLTPDGGLRDLRVVHAEPAGIFDQAAMRAMRGWKYPAPRGSAMQRRYRQTMVFVLNAAMARTPASSGAHAGSEEIRARAACQVVTGTHICRWPGDNAGLVREAAVKTIVGPGHLTGAP